MPASPMDHAHDLLLRTAQPADALRLIALSAQLGYGIDDVEVAAHLRRMQHDPNQLLLVAAMHCVPVGWVAAAVRHLLIVPPFVEIEGLVVDEAVRQQGVGRALLVAAEEWAAQRGVRTVRLRSNVMREPAHAFYRSCGYTMAKTSYNFSKVVEPHAGDKGMHEGSSANPAGRDR